MDDKRVYDIYSQHISASYPNFLQRLGIKHTAEYAEGALIKDSAGNTYIDCTAGYGLFNLGHNHPKVTQALIEQIQSKRPLTKPFITSVQAKFAERLASVAPGNLECTFLCNSGSEAVDSALKLARLTTGRKKIIAAHNSFHGYTYGALSTTGIRKFRHPFEPMLPEVEFVEYGSLDAARQSIDKQTAAIILEPIQHEAGIKTPPIDYFIGIREICNKHGVLLILDEVKTGFGKTGHLFACDTLGVIPDILILGKSLGGGMIPSGAIMASQKLWRRFGLSFPMSASSFSGNTLACSAGLATLEVFEETNLLSECLEKGSMLKTEALKLLTENPDKLLKISGCGLLFSLQLASSSLTHELSKQLVAQGVLAMPAFGNSSELMIEPPLVISKPELDKVIYALEIALSKTNG